MFRPRRILAVAALLLLLGGCDYLPFNYTPIGDIIHHPGRFEGEQVKVRGKVTEITKLPFLEVMTYTLDDGSGKILVLTDDNLPPMDKTVAIKAKVLTMAIVDHQAIGLRLKELKRLPTYGLGG
ncbi:MAG: hypothetical protein P8Z70_04930 [Desulfuromonadales bacterium]|jgi:hypothetical protein